MLERMDVLAVARLCIFLYFGVNIDGAVDKSQIGLLPTPLPAETSISEIPDHCWPLVVSLRICQKKYKPAIKSEPYVRYGQARFDALCSAHRRAESCISDAVADAGGYNGCQQYVTWETTLSQVMTAICKINETELTALKSCVSSDAHITDTLCLPAFREALDNTVPRPSQFENDVVFCRQIHSLMGCKWSILDTANCGEALQFQKMLDQLSIQPFIVDRNCTFNTDHPTCSPVAINECLGEETESDVTLQLEDLRTHDMVNEYCRNVSSRKACLDERGLTGCMPATDIGLNAVASLCQDGTLSFLVNQTCLHNQNSSRQIYDFCHDDSNTCRSFGDAVTCSLNVTTERCGCHVAEAISNVMTTFYAPLELYTNFCNETGIDRQVERCATTNPSPTSTATSLDTNHRFLDLSTKDPNKNHSSVQQSSATTSSDNIHSSVPHNHSTTDTDDIISSVPPNRATTSSDSIHSSVPHNHLTTNTDYINSSVPRNHATTSSDNIRSSSPHNRATTGSDNNHSSPHLLTSTMDSNNSMHKFVTTSHDDNHSVSYNSVTSSFNGNTDRNYEGPMTSDTAIDYTAINPTTLYRPSLPATTENYNETSAGNSISGLIYHMLWLTFLLCTVVF